MGVARVQLMRDNVHTPGPAAVGGLDLRVRSWIPLTTQALQSRGRARAEAPEAHGYAEGGVGSGTRGQGDEGGGGGGIAAFGLRGVEKVARSLAAKMRRVVWVVIC